MECKTLLKDKNPQDESNWLAKVFLTWNFDLFHRGYKQGLSISDLWKARNDDGSAILGDRLEAAWETEKRESKLNNSTPSLSKAIVRTFCIEYMLVGVFVGLLFVVVWPLIPYTLGKFIEYFASERNLETYRDAHIYNFLMNSFSMLALIIFSHVGLGQGRVGMRVRVASCSLMYRKILKLNHIGLHKTEVRQVINLMSNDVIRFDIAAQFLNYLWVGPMSVPLVAYLVWQHVGVATLAALLVMVLQIVVIQVYLSNIQGKFRGKIAARTDERVKVMSELISGIKVIKMYAWEKPFAKLVDQLRKAEVLHVLRTSYIKGFSMAVSLFTERFILFSAVATFVLLGGDIRAQTTFAMLQYFNLMQLICNILFPTGLALLAESKVSIKRIEEFLLLDETTIKQPYKTRTTRNSSTIPRLSLNGDKEKEKLLNNNVQQESTCDCLIVTNVSASWRSDSVVETLRNISMGAKPGEFVGIVGSAGSGKSSLLNLILGELKPKKGWLTVGKSRLSYTSQEPWLFAGTARDNILFGLPLDQTRYDEVVSACALAKDFELLPHGDLTQVGERGVILSGGQRARVALARACYRKADIYLLDDPLSAVDTQLGQHIISQCVQGVLRGATRLLVTHQLHHLKHAEHIVVMSHGQIAMQGSYEEVSNAPLFLDTIQKGDDDETALDSTEAHLSAVQKKSTEEEDIEENHKKEEKAKEISASGSVPASVYVKYFRAGGSWYLLLITVLGLLVTQIVTSFSDLWLTKWMNDIEIYRVERNLSLTKSLGISNLSAPLLNISTILSNTTDDKINGSSAFINITSEVNQALNGTSLEDSNLDNKFYIYVWLSAIIGCTVLATGRAMLFLWVCMRSSVKLHNQMFRNILEATMRFYDTNSSGRILNRFSKDMGAVDEVIPKMFLETIQVMLMMTGIIMLVAIVNPLMLLTAIVCGAAMYFWTVIYLTTAQAIKRLEGSTRSPVFSHVTATMSGLSTVRASHAQELLVTQFDDKQDVHTAAWYQVLAAEAAYALWLSMVNAVFVAVVAYSFLLYDDGTTKSGNVGLAVSQGLILVNMVQVGVRQGIVLVSQMISVERVLQYTSLPQENSQGSTFVDWPRQAKIVFKDLSLRCSEESELVLKNLNLVIESGWKVGVVGRTGAGKASLISALFRLAPIEGTIYIDGVDTKTVALKELRSKIAIIPQEPVLFSTSLRCNLDPFSKYSDAEIWKALQQVELKSSVTSLSMDVTSGGSNFSAGQRQLLCLARAALARNKLLVLDEATANVDPSTDAQIQKSIRKNFADCTVITVAHRLHTVADSDRVVVMEAGEIVECGHPHELLQKEEGHFTKMARQLGGSSELVIRNMAKSAYTEHQKKFELSDTS